LDTFVPALSEGVSTVNGVEYRDQLVYCLELTETGGTREFLGENNRQPNPERANSVIATTCDGSTSWSATSSPNVGPVGRGRAIAVANAGRSKDALSERPSVVT
jgi:hypothetical protein